MAQIGSPRRKPKENTPATTPGVAVADPTKVSLDQYLSAMAKEKGRMLKDRERKAAVAVWNGANKQAVTNAPAGSLEAQNAAAAAAEKDPAVQAARQKALQSQGFQESPAAGNTITNQPGSGAVEDFATTLKNARAELKKMSANDRLALAKRLNDAGIAAPLTGVYTDNLLQAYNSAITGARTAYAANKEFPTLNTYLEDRIAQNTALKAAGLGTGTGKATSYFDKTVFSDTNAANYINSEVRQFLNRDATAKEIASMTKALQDAQKKNPDKIAIDANGNRTTIQGVNPQGFLDNLIKALPEYAAKQTGKAQTTLEQALSTARANDINPTQSQIDAWTNRIKAGEDINTIQHEIRTIASLGQPDSIKKMMAAGVDLATIYQPYKNTMESILEIPASQIKLNDPSLRMAIGPDKEMNLYDFQKALRQDPRWQYTQNAKQDVSNSVQKVLQDFGFMG